MTDTAKERRRGSLTQGLLAYLGGFASALASIVLAAGFDAANTNSPDQRATREDVEKLRPIVDEQQRLSDNFRTSAASVHERILRGAPDPEVGAEYFVVEREWGFYLTNYSNLRAFPARSDVLERRLESARENLRRATSAGEEIKRCLRIASQAYDSEAADIMREFGEADIERQPLECMNGRRNFVVDAELARFDRCNTRIKNVLDALTRDVALEADDSFSARMQRGIRRFMDKGSTVLRQETAASELESLMNDECEGLDDGKDLEARRLPMPWENPKLLQELEAYRARVQAAPGEPASYPQAAPQLSQSPPQADPVSQQAAPAEPQRRPPSLAGLF